MFAGVWQSACTKHHMPTEKQFGETECFKANGADATRQFHVACNVPQNWVQNVRNDRPALNPPRDAVHGVGNRIADRNGPQ
jgi:hypothetical protein